MIVLLSPAKSLDYQPTEVDMHSQIRFPEESEKLVSVLKKKSKKSLKELMNISEDLANLNAQRYQAFEPEYNEENSKQAVLAFKGDVYLSLQADDFTEKELEFAQEHLRILSGLYGLLRPLDRIQPYRLEMGTSLKIRRKNNLYEFWGDKITKLLNEDLESNGNQTIINLASKEYFKSVKPKALQGEVINIIFKEWRGEKLKIIAFNAKKARGDMARQIVKQQITDPELLKTLDVQGYIFDESISKEKDWVFVK